MITMDLFRKHKQPAPQKSARAADSLDFRHLAPAKAAEPVRRVAKAPKRTPVRVVAEPAQRPTIVLPALIGGGLALAIAYVMNDPAPEAPAPAAVKAPPAAAPVVHQAPRVPAAPIVAPAPQLQAPAAPRINMPAVPTAFLEPFQAYTTERGSKALALALDRDGRFAHAVVSRHPVQAEANGEALADCERYRAQAGIQQSCRLFAIGDKIVW